MKKLISLLVFLFLAGSSFVYSQDNDSEGMKKWMEFMTPGAPHKMMETAVGTWNVNSTLWVYPGAEPITSTGTLVNEMLYDGRYLQGKVFTNADKLGTSFQGTFITAFDNSTQTYQNVWIDNGSTGIHSTSGTMSADGKTLTLTGTSTNLMTGKPVNIREVITFNNSSSTTWEFYRTDSGTSNEFKMMQIEYTR
jgi:hypothetical protein